MFWKVIKKHVPKDAELRWKCHQNKTKAAQQKDLTISVSKTHKTKKQCSQWYIYEVKMGPKQK